MTRIGLFSDTHGTLDQGFLDFFSACDEIWHAGDIGDPVLLRGLEKKFVLRAVSGNIDGPETRSLYPEELLFRCEELQVYMTHITGYPGKYETGMKELILKHKPGIVVGGHSHILKVIYDEKHGLLFLNPGAAGRSGLHQKRTALRFTIAGTDIREMEILELPR